MSFKNYFYHHITNNLLNNFRSFENNNSKGTYSYLKISKIKAIYIFLYVLFSEGAQDNSSRKKKFFIADILEISNNSNQDNINDEAFNKKQKLDYLETHINKSQQNINSFEKQMEISSSSKYCSNFVINNENLQYTENFLPNQQEDNIQNPNMMHHSDHIKEDQQRTNDILVKSQLNSQKTNGKEISGSDSINAIFRNLYNIILNKYDGYSLMKIFSKNISLSYEENINMRKEDQTDKTIFLRVIFQRYLISNYKYPEFTTHSRYYYLRSYNDNIIDLIREPEYKIDLIDFFAQLLAYKSKIFNTKIILEAVNIKKVKNNLNTDDISKIESKTMLFFDSLTNEKGFLNLKYTEKFKDNEDLKKQVFDLYSDFALFNSTANFNFLELIKNYSVIDMSININEKNEKTRIEDIEYNDMITITKELKENTSLCTKKYNIDLLDGYFIHDYLKLIDIFKDHNIKNDIYTKFVNYVVFISQNNKTNKKITIKTMINEAITGYEVHKLEWFPKIYEYLLDERFIQQLNLYIQYTNDLIKDIRLKISLNRLIHKANKKLKEFLNIIDLKKSIDHLSENLNEKSPEYLKSEILKNEIKLKNCIEKIKPTICFDSIYRINKKPYKLNDKDLEFYYTIKSLETIILSALRILKNITIIHTLTLEELSNGKKFLQNIFTNSFLPENMVGFLIDLRSFKTSFEMVANENITVYSYDELNDY